MSHPSEKYPAVILDDHAQALGAYPHARKVGNLIFVSGTSSRRLDNTFEGVVVGPDGKVFLDIATQTRAVIRNIEKILKAAGADLSNVVDLTTFLVNMKDFPVYNAVYREFFDAQTGPTRTTVAVAELPHPNLLIEIKVVAAV
jgi:2-aminomuconate deaminase